MALPYILIEKSVVRKPNSTKTIQEVLDEAYDWMQELQDATSVDSKFFYAEVVDSETLLKFNVYSNEARDYFELESCVIELGGASSTDKDVYSEEETLTNKVWMGKAVYRKLFELDTPDDADSSYETEEIENIDEVVHFEIMILMDNHWTKSIDNGNRYFSNFVMLTGVVRIGKSDNRIIKAKGYIEYTKL